MSTRESLKELHENKKGAVMLTGLCMSCFLIGSLWFVIGIGDAIVFRDTMQEVSDHAAFTSAVVHARGMNFISACNLILLAMITIHIILGLIHDILLAFCILFAFRVGDEEKMMLEEFGDAYATYMANTKRLVPGVW